MKLLYYAETWRKLWVDGSIGLKEKLQNLIFPNGLVYDKEKGAFRTPDLNYIIAEIARHTGDFATIKKGLSSFFEPKSLSAEKEGFEPSVRFPVRMFSKHVLSASQASLRISCFFRRFTNLRVQMYCFF